ncbi:MAG: type IX secretion system membrane protein PorP/SprF [Saprospiraceae bacterium]|nr:type IX secretion system membrane protein PorP/SprF [Saprospiraceae bacterium]
MSTFRQIVLGSLLFCFVLTLQAQDPVFSQFYSAPLQLNPAFAGTTYAPRISLIYRNQWSVFEGGFQTYAASYEQSIERLNSGFGVSVQSDNAADIYTTNNFKAVYGYRVQINRDWAIKLGVETGLIQTNLNWDKLIFGDQLDEIDGYDEDNPILSEEIRPENLNKSSFDVGAGLLLYNRGFYAGFALHHLNTPDESLLEINQNLNVGLPMRMTFHIGGQITLEEGNKRNPGAFISPSLILIRQGDFGQINGGALVGFGKFYGGLWYRHAWSNADAGIATLGYRYGVFRIGYSYDATISDLAAEASGTGGTHEISFLISLDDSQSLKRRRKKAELNDCFKIFN